MKKDEVGLVKVGGETSYRPEENHRINKELRLVNSWNNTKCHNLIRKWNGPWADGRYVEIQCKPAGGVQIKTTVSFKQNNKIAIVSENKGEVVLFISYWWKHRNADLFTFSTWTETVRFLLKSLKLCWCVSQWVKCLLSMSGNLSSIPVTHREMEGENHLQSSVLWHLCEHTSTCFHTSKVTAF